MVVSFTNDLGSGHDLGLFLSKKTRQGEMLALVALSLLALSLLVLFLVLADTQMLSNFQSHGVNLSFDVLLLVSGLLFLVELNCIDQLRLLKLPSLLLLFDGFHFA